MAEYITKEQAKSAIKKRLGSMDLFESRFNADIDAIPAADVVEVVHGRWEKNDYSQTVCSNCKVPISGYWGQYEGCPDGVWTEIEPTICCPNCGARMDGERGDT